MFDDTGLKRGVGRYGTPEIKNSEFGKKLGLSPADEPKYIETMKTQAKVQQQNIDRAKTAGNQAEVDRWTKALEETNSELQEFERSNALENGSKEKWDAASKKQRIEWLKQTGSLASDASFSWKELMAQGGSTADVMEDFMKSLKNSIVNASDSELARMWDAAFVGPNCDDDFLRDLGLSDKATAPVSSNEHGCHPWAQQPADVKRIFKEEYEDLHG